MVRCSEEAGLGGRSSGAAVEANKHMEEIGDMWISLGIQ